MFALRASARKLNDFSMSESQFRNSSSLLKPQLVGHTDKVGRQNTSKQVCFYFEQGTEPNFKLVSIYRVSHSRQRTARWQ